VGEITKYSLYIIKVIGKNILKTCKKREEMFAGIENGCIFAL
jgi:hypothetical protein